VTVTWTAPSDASTVTSYSVDVNRPSVGFPELPAVTYSPTTTSALVTGLINGVTYTFQVHANNAVGPGPNSPSSNEVVPDTGLLAPTIGTAQTDNVNGGVTVSWTAPTADGGSPVTGYAVTPYSGFYPLAPTVFNSTATTQRISGLQDGQSYRFRVRALNAAGSSTWSRVTNLVTYHATEPHAPTNVTAVAGSGQATISWNAPDDGGSRITSYLITPYIGYFPLAPTIVSAASTTTTVTDLANGTSYRFRVQASNVVGTGPYSKVSNLVTPTA
jgi:hypothetical protein